MSYIEQYQRNLLHKLVTVNLINEGRFADVEKIISNFTNTNNFAGMPTLHIYSPKFGDKIDSWQLKKFSDTLKFDLDVLKNSSENINQEISENISNFKNKLENLNKKINQLKDNTDKTNNISLKSSWTKYIDFSTSSLFLDTDNNQLRNKSWLKAKIIDRSNYKVTLNNRSLPTENNSIITFLNNQPQRLTINSEEQFDFISISSTTEIKVVDINTNITTIIGNHAVLKIKSSTKCELDVYPLNSQVSSGVITVLKIGTTSEVKEGFYFVSNNIEFDSSINQIKVDIDTDSQTNITLKIDSVNSNVTPGTWFYKNSVSVAPTIFNSDSLSYSTWPGIKNMIVSNEVLDLQKGINQFKCNTFKKGSLLSTGYFSIPSKEINSAERFVKGETTTSVGLVLGRDVFFSRTSTFGNDTELNVLIFGGDGSSNFLQPGHTYNFKTYIKCIKDILVKDCVLDLLQGYRVTDLAPFSNEESYCGYSLIVNDEVIIRNNKISTLYENDVIESNLTKFSLSLKEGLNTVELTLNLKDFTTDVTQTVNNNLVVPDKPYLQLTIFPNLFSSTIKSQGVSSITAEAGMSLVDLSKLMFQPEVNYNYYSTDESQIYLKEESLALDGLLISNPIEYGYTSNTNDGVTELELEVSSADPSIEIKDIKVTGR